MFAIVVVTLVIDNKNNKMNYSRWEKNNSLCIFHLQTLIWQYYSICITLTEIFKKLLYSARYNELFNLVTDMKLYSTIKFILSNVAVMLWSTYHALYAIKMLLVYMTEYIKYGIELLNGIIKPKVNYIIIT